jgi:hypothetical protein
MTGGYAPLQIWSMHELIAQTSSNGHVNAALPGQLEVQFSREWCRHKHRIVKEPDSGRQHEFELSQLKLVHDLQL